MSGWQPQQYDPSQQQPAPQSGPWAESGGGNAYAPQPYRPQQPAGYGQQQPQPYYQQQRPASRGAGLTAAGAFWYILQCIAFGAGYFAKVPAKKALQDFGMAQMTAAEQFWYVLMCIGFGAGYFAKLPVAKALSEMQRR
jgi:hypothetical protein